MFNWIDWIIVLVPLLVVAYVGWRTRKYVQSVSDFLAGGRVAGRYVLAVAEGAAGLGLITVIGFFEMYYQSGFAIKFWSSIGWPLTLLITLTGFLIYRYRETRAMTMAQFFEIRYSKRFRVFAGVLAFIAGLVNYALFPAVGGRFLIYYCGLPDSVPVLGMTIPTFGLVMAIFLSIALVMVMWGGQLTSMVIDCVAGLFSYAMFAVIVIAVLLIFKWSQMSEALLDRPQGTSMLNPFDTHRLMDFNILYVLIGIISSVYNMMSWQGAQGYNCAALNPHEQKMGKILGSWRGGYSMLMIVLLAIAAYTYMNHPDFSAGAAEVRAELAERINLETPQGTQTIRDQMLVPVALRHALPVGITGLFCSIMVLLLITTDTTYLHSWGTIFIQDIVLPLRKEPFTPHQQLWLLRLAITGVALFAFVFSLYFNQVTYIMMFFSLTGAIYLGGAGAVIIGGLYWKRGSTAGAWGAMITGSSIAICGFILQQYWAAPIYPWLQANAPGLLNGFTALVLGLSERLPFLNWQVTAEKFPISGQEILLLTMASSVIAYVGLSLLSRRGKGDGAGFNMDRMLHRGVYAKESNGAAPALKLRRSWKTRIGIDPHFTRGDSILFWSVFGYSLLMAAVWAAALFWNLAIARWTDAGWAQYFLIMNVIVPLVLGAITSVWYTIGGTIDLRRMFERLRVLGRNTADDGRVVGHVNAEDVQETITAAGKK